MTSIFGWCQLGDGIVWDGRPMDCPSPPVARITHPHGGTTSLCQSHLDGWLDNADDDPSIEPAGLVIAAEVLASDPR